MEKVEPALVPQRKLSNGMVIPGIGMGTFGNDRFSSEQTADAVYGAIQAGYRLFDCAAAYGNEKDIGKVFEKAFSNGSMCDQFKRPQTGLSGYLYGTLAISELPRTGSTSGRT